MSDLFPNALHVARREFLFRVRGRTFRITTALLALAVVAVTLLPSLLATIGVGEPPEIAVHVEPEAQDLSVDPVVAIQTVLVAGADGADGPTAPGLPEEPEADGAEVTRTDDPDAAADAVRADELDALLIIGRNEAGDLAFEYVGDAGPTNRTRVLITQAANAMAIGDRLERAGLSAGESARLFAPAEFSATPADPDDPRDEEDFGGSYLLAYVVVVLTFVAILTYGQWVAQSVAEEKSGRVMELLITAANPRQLLTGKVLGTGAAGLAQYAAIVVAAVVGLQLNGPVSDALGVSGGLPFELPELGPITLVTFGLFFLGGFMLYSILYAAAGSMVSRIEDVQQAAGPLLFVAMAGYFASFTALNDPGAGWVAILSMVPFFSPYLMPARMLLVSPGPIEIGLALVILAATIVIAILVAARIYSAGVLLYGQRAGLRTILRATRVAR